MSCRVLIIPEDPSNDRYILEPLVGRILEDCGKTRARVQTLENPRVQGITDARRQVSDIAERYSHFDLLLFLVDNDGQNRGAALKYLEENIDPRLICCAAIEECEAWLLAGHVAKLGRPWSEIRSDTSVKEHVFAPFLQQFGDRSAGEGRKRLMAETLANYDGLLSRCPEVAELRDRICKYLGQAA